MRHDRPNEQLKCQLRFTENLTISWRGRATSRDFVGNIEISSSQSKRLAPPIGIASDQGTRFSGWKSKDRIDRSHQLRTKGGSVRGRISFKVFFCGCVESLPSQRIHRANADRIVERLDILSTSSFSR